MNTGIRCRLGGDIQQQRFGVQLFVRPNRGRKSVSNGHRHRHRSRAARQGCRRLVGAAHNHRHRRKLRSPVIRHRRQ